MVLLAGGLPVVLLAPLSGLLLDRLPMGRLLAGAGLLVAAALTGLAFAHSLTATVLLVLGFGVADSILQPGLTAAIPQLAGDVPLVRATSRLQGATMAGTAIGPLLAGLVGSIGGTTTALLLGAALSVVFSVGISTLGLRRTRVPVPHGADDGVAAGVRYLRRDRPMGLLVLVVSAVIAFMGVTMVAELFLAEKVLHGGTTGYALLITAWTGGMTLGTVIAGRLPPRLLAPGIVAGLVVLGLGVAAGAVAPADVDGHRGLRDRRHRRRDAGGRCAHVVAAARSRAHRRSCVRRLHGPDLRCRLHRHGRLGAPGGSFRRPGCPLRRRCGQHSGGAGGARPPVAPPPGGACARGATGSARACCR